MISTLHHAQLPDGANCEKDPPDPHLFLKSHKISLNDDDVEGPKVEESLQIASQFTSAQHRLNNNISTNAPPHGSRIAPIYGFERR